MKSTLKFFGILTCIAIIVLLGFGLPLVWAADRGDIVSGETNTGSLSSPGFSDSWTFYGEVGDRVVITAAEISGFIEPEIFLYPIIQC